MVHSLAAKVRNVTFQEGDEPRPPRESRAGQGRAGQGWCTRVGVEHAAGDCRAHHAGDHEARKDHPVGDILALGAQSRRPEEHERVHGSLEQRLHGTQHRDLGVCTKATQQGGMPRIGGLDGSATGV